MNLQEMAGVVVRRWWIVVLVPLIGGIAALLAGDNGDGDRTTYRSEATLTLAADEDARAADLYTYIATETVEIEREVELALGRSISGDGNGDVKVESIPSIGAIRITAVGQPDEETADRVVQLYASVMSDYVTDRRIIDRDNRLEALEERQAELTQQVESLGAQLKELRRLRPPEEAGESVDPVLETALAAASDGLATVLFEQDQLRTATEADLVPFEPLGSSSVERESPDVGPLGRTGRLILGLLLGLALGVILALGLHRYDTRLYNRREAEQAYSLPVIAEVPRTSFRMRRKNKLVARDDPTHPSAEAYRVLRTSIDRARASQLEERPAAGSKPGMVVLVTSASADVGKSTSVANLAAVFADAGNTVLVVSADLRNPSLHIYFDVNPAAPGLVEAGRARRRGDIDRIDSYLSATNEPGVSFLPHGGSVVNPGDVLADALPLLEPLRESFDVIIIDSPPMLAGSDVDELLPAADLVVQIARAGRTNFDEGAWTDQAIQRRRIPTVGLVLIGSISDITRRSANRRKPSKLNGLLGRNSNPRPPIVPMEQVGVPADNPEAAENSEAVAAEVEAVVASTGTPSGAVPISDTTSGS